MKESIRGGEERSSDYATFEVPQVHINKGIYRAPKNLRLSWKCRFGVMFTETVVEGLTR
jgi:hypothetical protein